MSAPIALVTGATGGLGLSLIEELARSGRTVRATGRRGGDPRLNANGVTFERADLRDPAAAEVLCRDVGTVFHAAALSASWGEARAFEEANVTATARLLDAARRSGTTRFVYVSSPSVYACDKDRIGLTEDDLPASPPASDYARTKLEAERLVRAASGPGFSTVTVRPRAITGPDDKVLAPKLAEMVSRGWAPLLRGGRALVEFTDVRDVARALVACEANAEALAGQVLNISGGCPISVREASRRIAAAMGVRLRFAYVPTWVATIVADLLEARTPKTAPEPVLTRYTLSTLARSQTFDLSKARAAIGYEPRYDGFETLLAHIGGPRP